MKKYIIDHEIRYENSLNNSAYNSSKLEYDNWIQVQKKNYLKSFLQVDSDVTSPKGVTTSSLQNYSVIRLLSVKQFWEQFKKMAENFFELNLWKRKFVGNQGLLLVKEKRC